MTLIIIVRVSSTDTFGSFTAIVSNVNGKHGHQPSKVSGNISCNITVKYHKIITNRYQ